MYDYRLEIWDVYSVRSTRDSILPALSNFSGFFLVLHVNAQVKTTGAWKDYGERFERTNTIRRYIFCSRAQIRPKARARKKEQKDYTYTTGNELEQSETPMDKTVLYDFFFTLFIMFAFIDI